MWRQRSWIGQGIYRRLEGPLPFYERSGRGSTCIESWLCALLSREIANVWSYCFEGECLDEFGVADHIKSFDKINTLGQCAEWGTRLIKALRYFWSKWKEGGYGGVSFLRTEAMFVEWKRKRAKIWLQKAFQDFNSMAEEGEGAINSTQISWFIGFRNRGYNFVFPNGGNTTVTERLKRWQVLKS